MRVRGVVRLETPAADMTQGDFLIVLVFVRLFFRALLLVELYADVVLLHIALRNAFDVSACARSRCGAAALAGGVTLLLEAGWFSALFEGVLLRGDGEVGLDVRYSLFDGLPIVREFKLFHLPRLVAQAVSLKHIGMIIIEAHVHQFLQERELVCEFQIKPFDGDLGHELGYAAVYELVKSEILVFDNVETRDVGLQEAVGPAHLTVTQA